MYGPSGHTIVVNAEFISTTLDKNTWAMISKISKAGTAANYWNVGDVKYIATSGYIGTGYIGGGYGVFILGFNHNSALEGNGISFGTFKTTSSVDICIHFDGGSGSSGRKVTNINHWGRYNYGGWKASDIRYDILGSTNVAPSGYGSAKTSSSVGYDATSTCATSPVSDTLMAALPADLRAVMKPITKYTDNVSNGSNDSANVTASIDYLPLLSEYEIWGSRYYANLNEQNYQKQYQYYINGNSKLRYKHNNPSTIRSWWERSPRSTTSDYFCTVYSESPSPKYRMVDFSDGLCAVLLV